VEALDHFSKVTGLMANLDKSNIFIAGVGEKVKQNIRLTTGFSLGTRPIKYLGLPLTSKNVANGTLLQSGNSCGKLLSKNHIPYKESSEREVYLYRQSEMDNGNHVGGSGNGGFHSYHKSPQPTSVDPPSPDMEMSLELPAHLNQEIVEIIIQEQDRVIPNVVRIMHSIRPPHIMISDDAKQTMYHCISEFICFVTYETNAFEDDGGEYGSHTRESLLKRPMVDTASSSNITPYNLPLIFPMAHRHFVFPPPMGNGDIQGDAPNG
ncbi:hypothetical protein EJD97_011912, partial [Solanum chilense]